GRLDAEQHEVRVALIAEPAADGVGPELAQALGVAAHARGPREREVPAFALQHHESPWILGDLVDLRGHQARDEPDLALVRHVRDHHGASPELLVSRLRDEHRRVEVADELDQLLHGTLFHSHALVHKPLRLQRACPPAEARASARAALRLGYDARAPWPCTTSSWCPDSSASGSSARSATF